MPVEVVGLIARLNMKMPKIKITIGTVIDDKMTERKDFPKEIP